MPRFAFAHLLFAALALSGCARGGDVSAEQGVRAFMAGVFDRPEARLTVPTVATVGDYAVAGWLQDGRGGRALLKRSDEGWEFVVCSGDELLQPAGLRSAGLPADLADNMVDRLLQAEASLSSEQRARLGSFRGVLRMEGVGHPPVAR
jgi:hypothetical protein